MAKEPEDERHRDWLMYDFGQATANMMLAAAGLGIGSGHSAVINQSGLSAPARDPVIVSECYGQSSAFSRVRRLHGVQRGDIDGEPLVIGRGLLVVGELVSDLAGQVPGPAIRRPDSGSLNTSVASCPGRRARRCRAAARLR